MSDALWGGVEQDFVEVATRYRDNLKSELERIEDFLQTTDELNVDDELWTERVLMPGLFEMPQHLN